MTHPTRWTVWIALGLVAACFAAAACDPASSLTTPDYAVYLDGYETWQKADVVRFFNQLDEKRGEFKCQAEVAAAKRASWREAGGPIKLDQTPEGAALQGCLSQFAGAVGFGESPLGGSALQHWVNHNFVPEAQKALDDAVAAEQRRIGEKGCGGEQCELLTTVGDLVVPRVGQEVAVAYDDAVSACSRADYGGLTGWRLPTKAELVAMRESGKLQADLDVATYWSSSREYDDAGRLQAWVLRFDTKVAGQPQEPKLVPFDRDGVPTVSKVRCVSDLGAPPAAEGDVARDEAILTKAGCPGGWSEYVRLREGRVVGWKVLPQKGRELRGACKELSWCGLTWRVPSSAEAKQLAEDPWLREGAESRCVADLPASAE